MKRLDPLARAVDDYLALRRALGFKLHATQLMLSKFVAFLRARGSRVITTELALQWAQQPSAATQNTHANRLSAVRRFAMHQQAFDPRTEVPPSDLIPRRKQRKMPHIYSESEIAALMRAARHLPHPLRSATYTTLIGLLAVTGMRLGEAIALDCQDVEWRKTLLTLRGTKFGKTREVPIHESTLNSLHAYATRRDVRRLRRADPSFFISAAGTRLVRQNVSVEFAHLLQLAGLETCPHRRPRIHDLRHTFAVRTVRDWYRAGVNVEQRLPHLSTYLGHVSPSCTYWYLTATPELLSLACERAERAWRVQS
jgi:integrase